jgi:hypothetical protein
MEIIVVSSSFEKTKYGNLETAVEYMRRRVHENFTVYVDAGSQTQQVINKIRGELKNVLVQSK